MWCVNGSGRCCLYRRRFEKHDSTIQINKADNASESEDQNYKWTTIPLTVPEEGTYRKYNVECDSTIYSSPLPVVTRQPQIKKQAPVFILHEARIETEQEKQSRSKLEHELKSALDKKRASLKTDESMNAAEGTAETANEDDRLSYRKDVFEEVPLEDCKYNTDLHQSYGVTTEKEKVMDMGHNYLELKPSDTVFSISKVIEDTSENKQRMDDSISCIKEYEEVSHPVVLEMQNYTTEKDSLNSTMKSYLGTSRYEENKSNKENDTELKHYVTVECHAVVDDHETENEKAFVENILHDNTDFIELWSKKVEHKSYETQNNEVNEIIGRLESLDMIYSISDSSNGLSNIEKDSPEILSEKSNEEPSSHTFIQSKEAEKSSLENFEDKAIIEVPKIEDFEYTIQIDDLLITSLEETVTKPDIESKDKRSDEIEEHSTGAVGLQARLKLDITKPMVRVEEEEDEIFMTPNGEWCRLFQNEAIKRTDRTRKTK